MQHTYQWEAPSERNSRDHFHFSETYFIQESRKKLFYLLWYLKHAIQYRWSQYGNVVYDIIEGHDKLESYKGSVKFIRKFPTTSSRNKPLLAIILPK